MTTIEEKGRALLGPVLGEVLAHRTAAGVADYGLTTTEIMEGGKQ